MSEFSPESLPTRSIEELVKAADPQDYNKLPHELKPLVMRLAGKFALKITDEYSSPLPPPEHMAKYN